MTRRSLLPAWIVLVGGSACATGHLTHPDGIGFIPSPAVAARPFAVAVAANGVAYVGRQDAPYLQRTTLPDLSFGDSVRVGLDPTDIAFNAAGTRAYVTNQHSATLSIIDVAIGASTDSIGIPGAPFRVLVSPNNAAVYVSANNDTVYSIAASSNAVLHRWGFNAPVNGMAVNPDGAVLYASTTGGMLYRLNPDGGDAMDSVPIGGRPQDVALSPDGTELYLANEAGPLEIRNPASLVLIDTVPGAAGAFGVKPTPDGVRLYATYPRTGLIRIIDRATRTIVSTLTVGGTPRRIAFDRWGTIALVANEAGFVTVIR